MVYHAVGSLSLDGGICVTASHNPKEYTGMKIVRRGALPVGGDSGFEEIKQRAAAGFGEVTRRGEIRAEDIWASFVDKVMSFIDVASLRPLKIVVDAANGMAGTMLPPVLERLPQIEVVELLLRARRLVPASRAEPSPAREPGLHRREDALGGCGSRSRVRRRRGSLLLRRRHGRVHPRRLRHGAACTGDAREVTRRQGDLRRARELGRAAHDRGGWAAPR